MRKVNVDILRQFAEWNRRRPRPMWVTARECETMFDFLNRATGRTERPNCDCSTCVVGTFNQLKKLCKQNNIKL